VFSVQGNAANLLRYAAEQRPDHAAVLEGPRVESYAELADTAAGVAALCAELDIASGDRVAVLLPRGATAAAAYFGILAAGAVAVHVNESLRPRQIEHILEHSGARALLTTEQMLARQPRPVTCAARIVHIEASTPTSAGQAAPALTPRRRVRDDLAQLVYTSGSTGLPKGVAISHGNLWAGVEAVTSYLGLEAEDRVASLLPFSFDYGLNQLLTSVAVGATLVVERSSVPQRIVATLLEQSVTVLPAVPPLWLQLLSVEAFRTSRLPSLRAMTNTGGAIPPTAVRELRRAQPQALLFLMYGLTEAFRSTCLDPARVDSKPDSIGQAIPGAEILLLNPDGRPCAPGETGELVHRGPTVALGYWDDPGATAARFRANPARPAGVPDSERVVFSGDLVHRDEDGDLQFLGREDALIKTLGYRVSPDEVVDVLHQSGEVREAVVGAEPDPTRGSRIVAYVVLSDDGDIDRLKGFVARELPRYMQPATIETRASLERTSSGKFDVAAIAAVDHDSR